MRRLLSGIFALLLASTHYLPLTLALPTTHSLTRRYVREVNADEVHRLLIYVNVRSALKGRDSTELTISHLGPSTPGLHTVRQMSLLLGHVAVSGMACRQDAIEIDLGDFQSPAMKRA